ESWIAKLGPDVATVEVDGVEALVLARDLEGLSGCEPSDDVMLVPAFDPWVNGPGTADSRVVASARRGLATKGSNLVLLGGVVVGTWRATARQLLVAWFDEAGPAPVEHLQAGAGRLATSLRRHLE